MPTGQRINPNDYNKEELENLYKNSTLREVGKQLNLSHPVVSRLFDNLGIKRRTKSEATRITNAKRKYFHGEKNLNWKGGRPHHHGYIRVYEPDHPRANPQKGNPYVYEHILIWEQAHGKLLPKGWIVHHLNGQRDDNRPENLVAFTNAKHSRLSHRFVDILQERIRKLEKDLNMREAINNKEDKE